MGNSDGGEPDRHYRWYVLAVLMLVYTMHYVDRSVINAILEPIRTEFHLSDAQLGLLAGPAYAIAFAVAGLPLGLLIDRRNRTRLLALLLTIWSGLTLASGRAGGFLSLLVARMAVGAAEAGGSPTAMSILSDYFPPHRRATATGIFFLSVTSGILFGYMVSGLVAYHHGWRAAFFIAGAPGVALALLLILTVREPPRGRFDPPQATQSVRPDLRSILQELAGNVPLRWTLLGIIIAATVTSGFNAFVISLLVRRYEMGLGEAASVVALCIGLGGGGGSVLWSLLSDRLGRRGRHYPPLLIAWTSVAAAVIGIIGVLSPVKIVTIIGIAGYGTLVASFLGSGYGLLLNLAPPTIRGSCTAVSQVIINLVGAGFGPVVVGGLSTMLAPPFGGDGLTPALTLVLALSCGAALCHVAVSRALKHGG